MPNLKMTKMELSKEKFYDLFFKTVFNFAIFTCPANFGKNNAFYLSYLPSVWLVCIQQFYMLTSSTDVLVWLNPNQ